MIERRAFKRIPTDIRVKFFFGTSICFGTIANLSENGMFVNTNICFPPYSTFEILLPLKENVLNISVMVRRMVKEGDFYNAMGVEVLDQPEEYLQFVQSLKKVM